LLLSLIKLDQGIAVNVLRKMGLDLEAVRTEVEKQVGSDPETKMVGNIPYTQRVKRVLALAGKEAKSLNHSNVGTEHVLLGLLRESECAAARVLNHFGAELTRTRNEILKELDPNHTPGAESPPPQEPKTQSSSRHRRFLKCIANSILASMTPRVAPRLNNFTPRGQQVLALARKEADRFNHNYVGTEHLLLGLIKLNEGVAVNVLQKMGLELETVRMEVEKQVGSGPETKIIGNIPYTPRVKRVLALAGREAKSLNHNYVGTEHILLGLLREGEGVAARVLKNLEVDIERARNEILKELDPNATPDA